ncbi:CDT1-like protein a, chloroplastic isoform X2 [Macadamia integrifolia]|uniref:CDT1-like protein a, chloroplastic isoform X2 n=1 Tax=Macadamia integrifolia TaxID=60698 RepID=UPI001C4EAA02|nr:CDT1-like protein a, chloroplastic isoform X2 [Macadamia integrifolia]
MEQKRSEQSMQKVLDFKCKKILPVGEKSSALSPPPVKNYKAFENQSNVIVSPTPEKTTEPSRQDLLEDDAIDVFDKCKTLTDLLDRMDSSVRLLQLRKKLPTFQNICTQVEVLTKRKFSYCHLAQIKYILPEAVQIEKILVHDEKTLCMKPDLKISLLFNALPAHPDEAASMVMRQVFRARLLDFYDTHPKECDIPEATLPEPFNKTAINLPESLTTGSPKISSPTSIELELLSNSSHLSKSSGKYFSKKIIVPEAEKTQILPSSVPLLSVSSCSETNMYSGSLQEKEPSKLTRNMSSAEPIFSPLPSMNSNACKSPLVNLLSVADNLVTETPVQQTPKRSIPISDDKIVTSTGEARASSHSAAKRSLNFSTLNDDVSDSSAILEESKQHDFILSPQSSATKEILMKEDGLRSPIALSKMEENKDHIAEGGEISCKGSVKCRQMLALLPDLFDLVQIIFQSASFSLITKQELVHKIIWNNCDITDIKEVEEQLELLEELVPDWICKKLVPSGDIFYCITKVSDLVSIRERLVDAL